MDDQKYIYALDVVTFVVIAIILCVLVAAVWRIGNNDAAAKQDTIIVNSAAAAGTNLSFDPTIQNMNNTMKNFALPTNTDVTVAQIQGSGIVKRIWLALSGEPATTSVKIYVDGQPAPLVGSLSTSLQSGLNNSPVFASLMLGIDGNNTPAVSTSFMTDLNGMNRDEPDSLGGYLTLDMPFSTGFKVVLNCISSQSTTYNGFSQVFYENTLRIPAPFDSLRLRTSTFSWSTTYGSEYPLLNATGPFGVYLKGIKIKYVGQSGNWYEGRHRIYTGGPGTQNPISASHYTDSSSQYITPYDPTAQLLYASSGAEDFHLSSWGFINNKSGTSSNSSGYLYTSNPTTETNPNAFSTTTTWIATRYFGEGTENGLPHSAANETLLFTWACGDQMVSTMGACQITGIVYYYA